MSRNGKQRPLRPRIEVAQTPASPEQAAAIAAAIEQFLRDTAPRAPRADRATDPWLRAALQEGTRGGVGDATAWGPSQHWGS